MRVAIPATAVLFACVAFCGARAAKAEAGTARDEAAPATPEESGRAEVRWLVEPPKKSAATASADDPLAAFPPIRVPQDPKNLDAPPERDEARAPEFEALAEKLRLAGESAPAKRREAQAAAERLGVEALPVLERMLFCPDKDVPWERIGALRVLASVQALAPYRSAILARSACRDPDAEVRREAARLIAQTGDDAAVRIVLSGVRQDGDAELLELAALALREIGDPRAVQVLAAEVPPPIGAKRTLREQLGNEGMPATDAEAIDILSGKPRTFEGGSTQPRMYALPISPISPGGIGSLKIPVFLPVRPADGGPVYLRPSPQREALKIIAGKNMGAWPLSWKNWYLEWMGRRGDADFDAVMKKTGIRDLMNLAVRPEREANWLADLESQFREGLPLGRAPRRAPPAQAPQPAQPAAAAGESFDVEITKAQ